MSKIIKQSNKDIKKDNYATPKCLYNQFINNNYFDPCPLDDNFIINALAISWTEKAFINPPYSHILPFVGKAFEELLYGDLLEFYFLVPSHTGTKWFKELVNNKYCNEIIFFTNRLKFNDCITGATFDCCLIKVSKLLSYSPIIKFMRYEEFNLKGGE